MKKIINELINSSLSGVDVYRWKTSTWLIFTDQTRWAVELTDEGTLWYNYKFFNEIFRYVSLEGSNEFDGYITLWANDYFFKDCAHRSAAYPMDKNRNKTPKVLKNGIKVTKEHHFEEWDFVGDIVKGGVKEINDSNSIRIENRANNLVPKIIEGGIKETTPVKDHFDEFDVNKVIDGGIKKVGQHGKNHGDEFEWHTRSVINNGVKDVKAGGLNFESNGVVNTVINNGVKDVKPNVVFHGIDKSSMSFVPCSGNVTEIWRVIDEGIKEIKPSMATSKSGINYNDFMCSGNTTDISLIVEGGVKNTWPDMIPNDYNWSKEFEADVSKVIKGGVKCTEYGDWLDNDERINVIINDGAKT